MSSSIFMGSTDIPVERTSGMITSILVQAGARSINLEYDEKGNPIGISFALVVNALPFAFKLPVRVEPVFKAINGSRKSSHDRSIKAANDREQAERVAWRQIFRWLQAQLAMIQTNMVQVQEVFLPYMTEQSGKTLFEVMTEQRFKALPEGK